MYNVERHIETCIDSILSQTFTNFEVIVIDDRSTDQSYEIVSKVYCTESSSKFDSRVRLMQNIQNSERSFTRNVGLECARGEYIYFMDSDDALMPNVIEIFMNAVNESGADIIFMNSWFSTRDENALFKSSEGYSLISKKDLNTHMIKDSRPRFLSTDIEKRIYWDFIKQTVPVMPWIKVQRRESLFKHRIYFPLINRREDVLFNFAELCLIEKIQVIDACCYFYRKNSTSVTNSNPQKKIRMATSSLSEALRFTDQIIQSINCTESIRNEVRNIMEHRMIRAFIQGCFNNALRSKMTREEINSLLMELFCDPRVFDPNLMRVFFNYVAVSHDKE